MAPQCSESTDRAHRMRYAQQMHQGNGAAQQFGNRIGCRLHGHPVGLRGILQTNLELLQIVLAVANRGHEWAHRNVLVRCDNEAVVHVICQQTGHDPGLMHLLRCMHFFSARFDINVSAEHVKAL